MRVHIVCKRERREAPFGQRSGGEMIEDGVRWDNHNERPLVEGRVGGSRLVELKK